MRLLYINTCTLKMRWFDQTIIRSYLHLHHCIICSLDYWTSAVPVVAHQIITNRVRNVEYKNVKVHIKCLSRMFRSL